MFDISFTEIAIIGVIGLLVIKPEDLPAALRALGKAFGKMRDLSNEFSSMLEEVSRESGVDDLKKELKTIVDLDGNEQKVYDVNDLEDFSKVGNEPEIGEEIDVDYDEVDEMEDDPDQGAMKP